MGLGFRTERTAHQCARDEGSIVGPASFCKGHSVLFCKGHSVLLATDNTINKQG